MAQEDRVEEAGQRVEELLDQLQAHVGGPAMARVEELVRVLLDLYGTALEKVVELVGDEAAARLADDPLLSALMVLHGLHPEPAATRIEKALAGVRPYLGAHAGGVQLVRIDDGGVVHLRLEGTCHHCPSSAVTVRGAIESAVLAAAPEVTLIEVEGLVEDGPTAFVPLESVGLRCPTGLRVEAVP